MSAELLITTSIAVFAATVFQTIAGFGYAIIGIPILSTILGAKGAVIFLLVSGTYMRIFMLMRVYKEVNFSLVKLLFFGSLIGVIPGSLVLKYVEGNALNIGLGLTLILAVVLLKFKFTWHTIHEKLEQIFFGVVGGFFTSATSVGGPPIAVYMLHAGRPKEKSRADLICYFVLCNIWVLVAGYYIGNFKIEDFFGAPLWSLPAGFLGMYVGEKIFRHINQELFNKIALITILVSALRMIYKGLML